MSDTRVTAGHLEALYQGRMTTRLTAQLVEALYPSPRPPTRVSVLGMEAHYRYVHVSRVRALAGEVLCARAAVAGRRTRTMLFGWTRCVRRRRQTRVWGRQAVRLLRDVAAD